MKANKYDGHRLQQAHQSGHYVPRHQILFRKRGVREASPADYVLLSRYHPNSLVHHRKSLFKYARIAPFNTSVQ